MVKRFLTAALFEQRGQVVVPISPSPLGKRQDGLTKPSREEEIRVNKRHLLLQARIQLGSAFKLDPPDVGKKKPGPSIHGNEEEEPEEEEGCGMMTMKKKKKKTLQWGSGKRSRGTREAKPVVDEFLGFSKRLAFADLQRRVKSEKVPISRLQQPGDQHQLFCPPTPSPPEELPSVRASLQDTPEASSCGSKQLVVRNGRLVLNNATERADLHTATPPHAKQQKKSQACVPPPPPQNERSRFAEPAAPTRSGLELFEWPKIALALSRKEKEEDFIIMKGTKLPQRPKRRPKLAETAIFYCTPGTWLGDITKSRYEVREKKLIRKKPRGLKAMESNESDSEY